MLQISRHRDLRRRVIARLEERGIVTVSGDEKVMLVGNWLERLNEERERSGEIERLESDMRPTTSNVLIGTAQRLRLTPNAVRTS